MTDETVSTQPGHSANALLMQLLLDIKRGHLSRCESMGLTIGDIRAINQLSFDDLQYLMSSEVCVVQMHVDRKLLSILLEQARRSRWTQQMIDRALALGASMAMMRDYFGLTTHVVATRRRLLDIEVQKGRSTLLNESQEQHVWLAWRQLGAHPVDSLEGLDTMMILAERTGFSLTTLYRSLLQAGCSSPVRIGSPVASAGTDEVAKR
ncbi:DUF2857 domain-containing protein [Chania multitudinisentens]|uniref:DUF2857 domain-containing protein n=1 Tax=Chania multitudinisentens TaxID=1639108 RepID=UPI0003E149B0|nr:DUF2857 domain-containing protein [Chania multitudinisentens]